MAIESITGNTINSVLPAKAGAKGAADVKQKSSVPASADTVDFTPVTQDIKASLTAGATAPVINEDRVAAIKSALQSGGYQVDAERVAEKILRLEDKLPGPT